ncbi:MAG: ACP S-malonyltransferase [Thermoleophilia bacterium]
MADAQPKRGKIALMFPGQGSQQVGMGAELSREFLVARRTFEEANDLLGYDLARICFEGPKDSLMRTEHCQPAVLTNSVAAWRVAAEQGITGDLTMGHSLGEYGALVASGALDFSEALRLVQERVNATTEVAERVPGQMAALLGASDEEAEAICAEAGDVWPANYNCPGQIVASGLHRGVERLQELARARNIKFRLLDVEGAFHSSVMAPAAERLREALTGVRVNAPNMPFLSATTAALEAGTERVRTILTQQLTGPVRFTQSVRTAMDMGVDRFVEFGPRSVLVGLVRRVRSDVQALHLGTPDDLPGIAALTSR